MPTVTIKDTIGAAHGSLDLDEATFGIEPNVSVMHQVVTAQLAARRAGTQSTKTRAEVRGGGAKPWKQKGTGRARQGSIRSPQWKGGGVALGPKPRSYAQRTPKKMIKLALRSALSDRAAEDQVVVVDEWRFDVPSTKAASAALTALGLSGRIVVVVGPDDANAVKSFRNLPNVHVLEQGELNAYDILVSDFVVFTKATLPDSSTAPAPKSKAAKPAAAAEPTKAAKATKAPKATKATEPTAPAEADTDDLPARPAKSEAPAESGVAAPRVMPAGSKTDPRFEAARIKSEKEAEVRSAKEQAPADAAEADADPEVADPAEPAPSGGFSFNATTETDEAGQ
jgi:large subunit ribosomal protein L4